MGWKEIWQSRSLSELDNINTDFNEMYTLLKKANGFDVVDGGLSIESLLTQYEKIKWNLSEYFNEEYLYSVYEVGCGSGANLMLFAKEGHKCGGLDYSNNLIEIAQKVLASYQDDIALTSEEAINLNTDNKFDVILSNSVFSYFSSLEYSNEVLNKMYEKSNGVIVLIDIHDLEKKEDFLSYRRSIIPNYDEKYKNLEKLFYNKTFFEEFALKNNMSIYFEESTVDGYWNNEFVYNCYMYKL